MDKTDKQKIYKNQYVKALTLIEEKRKKGLMLFISILFLFSLSFIASFVSSCVSKH